MPELPEVESIRRVLQNSLINQNLQKYKILDNRINRFNNTKPRNLGTLLDISRKGKILQFIFKKNSIFFHLGMSGRLDLNGLKNKHTHGIFFFENDVLLYDDIRKFGYIKILKNEQAKNQFAAIGPDSLSLTKKDKTYVLKKANRSSTSVKNFLLNQKNLSGLGNIYVNEILFLSGVHPLSKTFNLKDQNWNAIFVNTKKVLQKAIKNNGTTLSDMTYILPQGAYGNNQNSLYIYAKDKCFSCTRKIDKILVDSRATYVCKKCQKQIN
tara:strand:+ start:1634 stop:2437 length:804 start_codon:yes stop_codon:yes gene_type:complete